MRLFHAAGMAAVLSGVLFAAPIALAVVVADLEDEFRVAGGPTPGWRYLYNPATPPGTPPPRFIHDPANYAPLSPAGDRYEAPGTGIVLGSGPVTDVLAFPPGHELGLYPDTFVRPGPGFQEDPAGFERAVILAYTFSAEEIAAAGGGRALITGYDFAVSALSADGMSARVYRHNDPAPILDFSADTPGFPFPFPPTFRFTDALDPEQDIGTYAAGETVYFVIGPNGNRTNDELRLDFTISLVPEPGTLSLAITACGALLMRRRSR